MNLRSATGGRRLVRRPPASLRSAGRQTGRPSGPQAVDRLPEAGTGLRLLPDASFRPRACHADMPCASRQRPALRVWAAGTAAAAWQHPGPSAGPALHGRSPPVSFLKSTRCCRAGRIPRACLPDCTGHSLSSVMRCCPAQRPSRMAVETYSSLHLLQCCMQSATDGIAILREERVIRQQGKPDRSRRRDPRTRARSGSRFAVRYLKWAGWPRGGLSACTERERVARTGKA